MSDYQAVAKAGMKKVKKIAKKCQKIWRIKKSPYLCSPFEK